jgi:hypothetical protein
MPNHKYKSYSYAADMVEDIQIARIDARKLFKAALGKIKDIQSDPNYWSSPKLIKEVKVIMSAMYQVWGTKTLNEALEDAEVTNQIDGGVVLPVLIEANEAVNKTINVEISGRDGGPIETMRRISPEDFEKFGGMLEMLKTEQRGRLIPIEAGK